MVPQGFYLLRRPLMPLETLFRFHQTAADTACFEKELLALFSGPVLSEAVFTASPGLYEAFRQLEAGKVSGNARQKIFGALYKYLVRVCSRATPYGLFAGVAVGLVAPQTSIRFAESPAFRRTTRLDRSVLSQLAAAFLDHPAVRRQLRYRINSSLQLRQGAYRYAERTPTPDGPMHLLAAVASGAGTDRLLNTLEDCTAGEVIAALGDAMPPQEVEALLEAMFAAQLIVSDLEENVTGPEYLDVLIAKLSDMKGTRRQVSLLTAIRSHMDSRKARLRTLHHIRSLLPSNTVSPGNEPVVQTDITFPTTVSHIGRECVAVLTREFENLRPLLTKTNADLENFGKEFFEKYEKREVSLLTALDSESGVGYGHVTPGNCDELPLLGSIRFPESDGERSFRHTHLSHFKEVLLERALSGSSGRVLLTDKDLAELKQHPLPSWEGLYWLGSIFTDSQDALDQGDFRFLLRAAGGPSGFELLGRFCHLDDLLEQRVRQAARVHQEQDQDVLYAEIAHLPGTKAGNILRRPHIRDYEIVYLCGSTRSPEHRIAPSDLTVSMPDGISIVLRSRKFDKRVIPRMATAHNYTGGLPLYRFLCDVSVGRTGFGWDWGHLSGRSFLPAVRYGHWVISRAAWNLEKERLPELFHKHADFHTEWNLLRNRLRIPRYVQLCRGDNELLIDSEYPFSTALLKEALAKDGRIRLVEFLQGNEAAVSGLLNGYTNEIVLPFHTMKPPFGGSPQRCPQPEQRDFPPGSAWLYVKLYCGTNTADKLLTGVLRQLCRDQMDSGILMKWFFIRYHDPAPHIRLRFYNGRNPVFWQEMIQMLNQRLQPFLADGTIAKIQNDTYSRELERYSGLEFDLIESVFHADSEAVAGLLVLIENHDDENLRWVAGLMGADALLDDFGLNLPGKRELTGVLYRRMSEEFEGADALRIQMDAHYRAERATIGNCLDSATVQEPLLSFRQIFERRSATIRKLSEGRISALQPSVTASFVHMFFNRLLLSKQRQQELVLYHHLSKHYTTEMKKNR